MWYIWHCWLCAVIGCHSDIILLSAFSYFNQWVLGFVLNVAFGLGKTSIQVIQKKITVSLYSMFIIFEGTKSYDSWMKAHFYWVCVCVVFIWPVDLLLADHKVSHSMSPVISSTASFCTSNSWTVWVGAVHKIFEMAEKEIMVGIYIQKMWWSGLPTSEAFWKLIQ